MKYNLKTEINETDIKRGLKTDPFKCPVARAVRRTLRENKIKASDLSVCSQNIEFVVARKRIQIIPPKKVTTFIHTFDIDRSLVKPFSFQLRFSV